MIGVRVSYWCCRINCIFIGVFNGFVEVSRSSVFYFVDNESINLRGRVFFIMSFNLGIIVGVSDDFVGDVGDVFLDFGVFEFLFD